jgi:voltage-gated potassium channel
MVTTADIDILSSNTRIADWERRTRWVIVTAALAPFVVRLAPLPSFDAYLAVDLITWAVFAFDLYMHIRISRSYAHSPRGLFDIAIVVLTFPWYVFPSLGSTAFTMVFRWARVARLLFAGETGRRFTAALRRLGTLGIALTVTSLLSALIVMRHEPAEAGFESFGDALWWAVVSFTTVGYGDLYPTTPEGRVAGGIMMFMGLVALGTVSAVLASTFVGDDREPPQEASEPGDRVLEELGELRAQVELLSRQLAGAQSAAETLPGPGVPAPASDPE